MAIPLLAILAAAGTAVAVRGGGRGRAAARERSVTLQRDRVYRFEVELQFFFPDWFLSSLQFVFGPLDGDYEGAARRFLEGIGLFDVRATDERLPDGSVRYSRWFKVRWSEQMSEVFPIKGGETGNGIERTFVVGRHYRLKRSNSSDGNPYGRFLIVDVSEAE